MFVFFLSNESIGGLDLNVYVETVKEVIDKFGYINVKSLKEIFKWTRTNRSFTEEESKSFGWDSSLIDKGFIYTYDPGTLSLRFEIPDPLKEVSSPYIPAKIDDGGERISYGEGMAIREPSDGKGRFDLITPFGIARLARWYELGAKKYSDRNWEKGIPFSRYIDSASRHINKYIKGMEDEDHLAAAVWNLLCIIHHEELGQRELDDMPHYLSEQKEEIK